MLSRGRHGRWNFGRTCKCRQAEESRNCTMEPRPDASSFIANGVVDKPAELRTHDMNAAGVSVKRASVSMRNLQAIFLAIALAIAAPVDARGGGSHSGGSHSGGSHHSSSSSARSHTGLHASRSATTAHASRAAAGVPRDSAGRAKRDPHQRAAFMKSNPCPSTGKRSGACPGYVVDHVQPLKRGGPDRPSNMQWQTKEAARQKDRTE